MELTESWENYLETILILKNQKPFVRSIDIANELDYSKASISRAVGNLRDANLITVGDDGGINFTDKGLEIAESIYEKHVFLSRFLKEIGVDSKTAVQDACKIEHVITEMTFEKLKEFVARYWPNEMKKAVTDFEQENTTV